MMHSPSTEGAFPVSMAMQSVDVEHPGNFGYQASRFKCPEPRSRALSQNHVMAIGVLGFK